MAVYRTELHEHVVAQPAATYQGIRVAWGGVWTGFLVAVGVFLLLSTLGLAIGISSANIGPSQDLDAGALGTGAAIWSGITLLIALFAGGLAATRTGVVYDKAAGVVEGGLVWVLSVLAILYMATSGIGMLAGAVSGAFGGLTRGAQAAVSNIDVGALTSGDASQIVQRLNDPNTVKLVAAATGMSQDEARSTLGDIAKRVQAAQADPTKAVAEARQGLQALASRAATRVEQAAAAAQPYASATMWTTLLAMVLSLLAAVGGALVGRRQIAKRVGEED